MPSITELPFQDATVATSSEGLIASLDSLTLSGPAGQPSSAVTTLLQAFKPDAAPLATHKAHLSLARLCGIALAPPSDATTPPPTPGGATRIDADALTAPLLEALQAAGEEKVAALRLLCALAALAPDFANELLPSLLSQLLVDKVGEEAGAALQLRAQLLASLASHAAARTTLGGAAATSWCDSLLDAAELKAPTPDLPLARAALAAGLARLKLGVQTPEATARPHEGSEQSDEAKAREVEARELRKVEEEEAQVSLFALARAQVIASLLRPSTAAATTTIGEDGRAFFKADLEHSTQLNALEALAHLAPMHKYRIANDAPLLKALCDPALGAAGNEARRSVFPARGGSSTTAGSSYDVDPTAPRARADGAAAYALASLLSTLVAHPQALSAQEQQMLALRHKASGTTPPKPEAAAQIEGRAKAVIEAGGGACLVRLVSASSAQPTRTAISAGLLGLATPQDRSLRARLVKEGVAKALLALSSASLSSLEGVYEETDQTRPALEPLQALAKLCISISPAALFAVPLAPLRALSALFLCPAANALQRFEACLALTNLASLPSAAGAIAAARWEGQSVEEALRERIAAPLRMERRAAVELLCNLVADDTIASRWAGEEEDELAEKAGKETEGKSAATGRLHVLLALCAPALEEEEESEDSTPSAAAKATETTLPTRLAASGALASLLGSPSACARLLSLPARTLNILARCLVPGTQTRAAEAPRFIELTDGGEEPSSVELDKVDEEAEAVAEARDAASSTDGRPESARCALALRAVSAVGCIAQYAAWLASTAQAEKRIEAVKKLRESGLVDATMQCIKMQPTSEAQREVVSIARQAADMLLEAGLK